MKLRTVMDEAFNLAPTQQKQSDKLREAIRQLTYAQRAELDDVVRHLDKKENR